MNPDFTLYILGYPGSALYQYTGSQALLESTKTDYVKMLGRRMRFTWDDATPDESVALALYYALRDIMLKVSYILGISWRHFSHTGLSMIIITNSQAVVDNIGAESYQGRLMAILNRSTYYLDR
jgi:hypothetical protein